MTYVSPMNTTPAKASFVIDGGNYFTATNVEDALSEIYEMYTVGSPFWTHFIGTVTKSPTGIQNRAESTITFTDGTMRFSIQPVGANFDYYIAGVQYISTGDTVDITDTEGLWYIYYAGSTLTASQVEWTWSAADFGPVGIVYWDATNNTGIIVGDERHETVMDAHTHDYLHDTVGTRYESGGALSEGSGGDEGKIAIASLKLHDESIEIAVVNGTTGNADWEQTLGDGSSTWASIPVFYRSGASNWRRYTTTAYPYYDNAGGDRIHYNSFSSPNWSSTALPANNRYTAYWIFGTNNLVEPIIAVMGQGSVSNNLQDARDENDFDDLNLGDLPSPEMKILYRLIFKANAAGVGNPTLEDVTDYRAVAQIAPSNSNAQDHASLGALSADDHIQYLLDNGSRDILSGTILDMYWTGATTLSGATEGIHIDMSTNITPNDQDIIALKITMPAYGAGTEYAIDASGDGRTFRALTDTYALEISGAMQLDGVITAVDSITLDLGATIDEFSIDDTLGGDSDSAIPTEQAVKAYVDGAVGAGGHDHDTDTLQLDGVNSDGGAFSFLTTGAITFNQQLILTHAIAGTLDINPANTGSQKIIDITPSASLVAGSVWYGNYMDIQALDPATGAACTIAGYRIDASTLRSVDNDASVYGFMFYAPDQDSSTGIYHSMNELDIAAKIQSGFVSYGTGAYSVSSTYRGIHLSWATITRDANAPILEGVRADLPADYSNFGTSFAGQFTGDGRTVLLCDTTYALDVTGTIRTTGDGTITGTFGVGGLLTADGLVPEGDLADSIGTAALTWLNIYVQDWYDAANNQILGTDGAGKIDALANISSAVIMESDLTVDSPTFHVDAADNSVGIGTVTPTANLHIFRDMEDSTIDKILYIDTTDADETAPQRIYGIYDYMNPGGTGWGGQPVTAIYAYVRESRGQNYSAVFIGGNVGIDTETPTEALDIVGNITMIGGIDINPSATGSQNIIDITPSASLNAGSVWKGIYQNLTALDPATGAASDIRGIDIDASGIVSVDKDAQVIGMIFFPPASESSYAWYQYMSEINSANEVQTGLFSFGTGAYSVTGTYRGVHIDWDAITRDANAPVLEGIRVQLPADYSNFGTSFAGYFSGDGRSVTICDTTYALDVSGAMRFDGVVTGVNSITLDLGATINEFSIDDTLGGDSDSALPTEQAVKAYVDGAVGAGGHDHDTDTLQLDGINSDGGAFSFSTTGAITYNQQQIYTHAVAGMLDLNPANTGTQDVINITPSATLAAGVTWRGLNIVLTGLDPATGAAGQVLGIDIDARGLASIDGDSDLKGFRYLGNEVETNQGFYAVPYEMTVNKIFTGFGSYNSLTLSATATYRGVEINWTALARDANAPVLEGIKSLMPANYTNYGTSYAGYFSGDGRTVLLCDTTYALDVSGTTRITGDGTITGTFGVGGLLTADGIVPEGDLVDDLGTDALTWRRIYVNDIYDSGGNNVISFDGAGNVDVIGTITYATMVVTDIEVSGDDIKDSGSNVVISFDGVGKIDILANISAAVTMESTLAIQGLLTTDGIVPEGDLADSIGTAALTWLNIYVQDYYDAAGNQIIGTDGAGKIDALANISAAVVMESTLTVTNLITGNNGLLITGNPANFDTDSGNDRFYISRLGGTTQALEVYIDDTVLYLRYDQDEVDATPHKIQWNIDTAASGAHEYAWQIAGTPYMTLTETTMVLDIALSGIDSITLDAGETIDEFSSDGTMGGNSDSALPTEAAIVTYTAAEIATAIGAGGHDHDTDTLQLDAINSDGGAFAFDTTGDVTFNQDILTDGDLTVLGTNIWTTTAGTTNSVLTLVAGGGFTDGASIEIYGHTAGNDGSIHFIVNSGSGTPEFRWWEYDGGVAYTEIAVLDMNGNFQIDGDLTISGGNITNAITCDSTLNVLGLLTADGLVPEADKVDSLGTATLTWNDLFVVNIKDDDGTIFAKSASDGKLYLNAGTGVNEFSIDDTLVGNSDDAIPTEQAVKAYVDGKLSDAAFAAAWNGVTTVAPSKNAIYDYFQDAVITDNAGGWATTSKLVYTKVAGGYKLSESALSESTLLDSLMYGSANASWVPMVFAGSNNAGSVFWSNWGGYFRNDGGGDMRLNFTLGIPFVKGSLSITITDIRLDINDADAGDYISRTRAWSDGVIKVDDGTNYTVADQYDIDITDCSPTEGFHVYVECINTNQADLKFNIMAKCYYS